MARLFVLVKRKGAKRFLGVIPGKPGVTKTTLKRQLARQIKKGFSFKIVTVAQLKNVIKRQRPRGARIRRIKKRKGKRKTRSRKKKR